jgi:hypothetical protein
MDLSPAGREHAQKKAEAGCTNDVGAPANRIEQLKAMP